MKTTATLPNLLNKDQEIKIMKALSTLVVTAKTSPIKTGLVVVGTAAAVAGTVYGVKVFRKRSAKKKLEAELTAATVAAAEVVAEAEKVEPAATANKQANRASGNRQQKANAK